MSDSDSEDDKPLAMRRTVPVVEAVPIKPKPVAKPMPEAKPKPVSKPKPKSTPNSPAVKASPRVSKSVAPQARPKAAVKRPAEASEDDDDDDGPSSTPSSDGDSDVPLARRASDRSRPAGAPVPKRPRRSGSSSNRATTTRPVKTGGQVMWQTLHHHGVLFPPEYERHNVKMLYDGKPVELTKDQEEVASMFAVMKETDYMTKPTFIKNFWDGFKAELGPKHVIKSLEKCDFTPIYEHLQAEREKKKAEPREVKIKQKADKDAIEGKYKKAMVDGKPEEVGNCRVEPPGLFRGRGEHPRMGKIKKRVYPRDVTINIGKGEPIPEHPYPDQKWKEVRHDQTVTWLAFWKDTIAEKETKYVFLGATSAFKADSDLAKYEKARKLKDLIDSIRTNYEADWDSTDMKRRQMAVAIYFLDKLALRAGHEKDEDEADTVGCCSLKVENVEMVPPNKITFDFLGKDSIKYENTVEVPPKVYKNVEKFRTIDNSGHRKGAGAHLFDTFDATALNKELRAIYEGLSVKVFRTYNASITLDRLLYEHEALFGDGASEAEKKASYDLANKEVAILCNHQRAVGKAHDTQMTKLTEEVDKMKVELNELKTELGNGESDKASILRKIEKKKELIVKKELQMKSKEDMKTVALGTSKINYMDPRISIAWCKRNDVPIERIFAKTLLGKFKWAMDVEPEFKF